jgi:hypothetical protein
MMPWQGLALINRLPQACVNCSLGGDEQQVRFAPREAGAFDQRHHVAGLDLAHGQRAQLLFHAPVLGDVLCRPPLTCVLCARLTSFLARVALVRSRTVQSRAAVALALQLLGRRVAALLHLGALEGGDAARLGQADVGVAALIDGSSVRGAGHRAGSAGSSQPRRRPRA